jgi:nitroreductase
MEQKREGMLASMKKRRSVRTFAAGTLDGGQMEVLAAICDGMQRGPFGHESRFVLVSIDDFSSRDLKAFGTYGLIRGARAFIVGVMKGWNGALAPMVDFGFCFERIILLVTAFGLGTCWLGGALHRSRVAASLGLAPDEIVPAMTPVGHPVEKPGLAERFIRMTVKAERRKPWSELFFEADSTPLSEPAAGRYAPALEAVRFAPSASNKQPWRVQAIAGSAGFHFFLKRTPGYRSAVKEVDLQAIDMGIGLRHFEEAARELGLPGAWRRIAPAPAGDGEYCVSWTGG